MEKGIQNENKVACKLRLASIKATNYSLEVAREKLREREEIVERRKTKTMAARRQRVRRGICSSSEEEENDETDTKDETDPD